jgi:hypothetical protein
LTAPAWNGQPLEGKTLHVWGEQGVGDQVLYAGVIDEARARAGRCVLECEPRLVPLFERSFAGVEVVPQTTPAQQRISAPDIGAQIAVGSLSRFFRTDLASFPRHRGYLRADPTRVALLRERYRRLGSGRVVGLSWRSTRKDLGLWKSAPLAGWAPILAVPGVAFINLQYGDCTAELVDVEQHIGTAIHCDGEVDPLKDLDAFAAQISALDLVITTSNTTAHFAGALGVPVWTLLPAGSGCSTIGSIRVRTAPGIRQCGCSANQNTVRGTKSSRAWPKPCGRRRDRQGRVPGQVLQRRPDYRTRCIRSAFWRARPGESAWPSICSAAPYRRRRISRRRMPIWPWP